MIDEYEVVMTQKASSDFAQIYLYLAYVLMRPDLASKIEKRLADKINSVSYMPKRFREFGFEECRVATVKYYKIIYCISESDKKVYILKIIYSLNDKETLS